MVDYFTFYSNRQSEYLKKCVVKDILKILDIFQHVYYEKVEEICNHIISTYYDKGVPDKNFNVGGINVMVNYFLDESDDEFCVVASMENELFLNITILDDGKKDFFEYYNVLLYKIFISFLKSNRRCSEDELYMYNSLLGFIENSFLVEIYFYWLFWMYYEKVVGHKRDFKHTSIVEYEKFHNQLHKKFLDNSFYGIIMNWMNSDMIDVFSGERKILNDIDKFEVFKIVDSVVDIINEYSKNRVIIPDDSIDDIFKLYLTNNKKIYDSVSEACHSIMNEIISCRSDSVFKIEKDINGIGLITFKINKVHDVDWEDKENVIICQRQDIDNVVNVNVVEHRVFMNEDLLNLKFELLKCLIVNK